jgi:predicted DCC family thiol-disulfide oxidoreductase YuxK
LERTILFDGVCNLCSGWVQFVSKRDPNKKFNFSSLQSEYSAKRLKELNYQGTELSSIIYIKEGKVYSQSTAVLNIVSELSWGWPLLYVFIIVPKFIRDFVYDFVARNRYRWFGEKDVCEIPDKIDPSVFIE